MAPEEEEWTFETILGKLALVGLRRLDTNGVLVGQIQYHGRIVEASTNGIVVETTDGGKMTLPPHLAAFQKAPPGDFKEHSTGAVIGSPDVIAMWQIRDGNPDPEWTFTRITFPSG